jgi:hypothetical protein
MVRRSSYICYGSIIIVQRAGDPMQDTRTTTAVESARRIAAARRRAKRGLVAGYIHELSSRHGSPSAARKPAEPAPQPARAT